MGTCRGWQREGWGTMGRQLLQLLGRAIILPSESSRLLQGGGESSSVLVILQLLEALRPAGGVSTAAGVPPLSYNCTFWRGQLTFDLLLLCPSESLLGQTVGKWQGCITSKINISKYVSDASSFTNRLPNSHSLLLRPA